MGYCCDKPDYVILGKTVERLWNVGLEKPLSVESEPFCGSLGDKNVESRAMIEEWVVKFQRDVLKTIMAICYFELKFCGSDYLGLETQETNNIEMKTLHYWEN